MKTPEEKRAADREASRKYRKAHPERASVSHQQYYDANREAVLESSRKWRRDHPEQARERNRKWRENHRGYRYGVIYEQLLTEQAGVCAICDGNRSNRALGVDHDHNTGTVRGLLCDRCNKGLGFFADNPEWLERAAEFLRRAQKTD